MKFIRLFVLNYHWRKKFNMAIKTVITDYDVLSEISEEIDLRKENNLARETTLDLKHTMQKNEYAVLAAPQIGVKKRIFCINFNGDIRTFCNPMYKNVGRLVLNREKCPSIPGKEYFRFRHDDVELVYQTPMGKIECRKFTGMAAYVVQYAVDMLDGLLISDVGLEILDGWEELSEADKNSVIDDYIQSLDLTRKEVKKEINENKELKQLSDAIDFIESVKKGETHLESNN